jgi:N-methylhydantoinase B
VSVSLDIVTLGVIGELFVSAVREMRVTMIRTAHSSVIYEGHDFSCALLDCNAELVAQSEDSPAHIFPLASQAKMALEFFGDDLHSGDAILVNDPYHSGTHMNDVAMIVPIFVSDRLIAISVVRAHWADIGGMVPGSISGLATEIFQEGLRIPFVKVFERGEPVRGLLNLILANVRVPDESEGDFYAMVSCCATGRRRIEEMVQRFGLPTIEESMRQILERGEQRMRKAISELRPGIYRYEDYFDSDALTGKSVLLRIAVTIDDKGILCDFTGSSEQIQGPLNCSLASSATGTFTALKALLDPHSPINGGAFRPVVVQAPPGTITNAHPPAACGGFGEMRRRIESVTMGALSVAAPRYIAGDTKGTSNHVLIGSTNARRGRRTVFYEWPAGGTGGFLEADGSHAMRAYDEGDFGSIMPVEAVEQEHALLIEKCELRVDSCGDGTHRGGLGLRREIRLLAESGTLSVLSDRNVIPPFGVRGGFAGAPNRFRVLRDGVDLEPSELPGKISGFPLRKDDVVIVETAGGGGYGDPALRDPRAVALDVEQGYISAERAYVRYGLPGPHGSAGPPVGKRSEGEAQVTVRAVGTDEFEDGRRVLRVSEATARLLGLDVKTSAPRLIELVNPGGAPLRAWAKACSKVADGSVELGPMAMAILKVPEPNRISIRIL